jgi:hypothetical protein
MMIAARAWSTTRAVRYIILRYEVAPPCFAISQDSRGAIQGCSDCPGARDVELTSAIYVVEDRVFTIDRMIASQR